MKKIHVGLIIIAAAVIASLVFVPARFLVPNVNGDIEYAKDVTSLELRRFELIRYPNNIRNWLAMQDGAPGQEVAMRFVSWGLTHQSDFALILEGLPEQKRSATINFLATMINDRFAEDAFLSSFEGHSSPAIDELRTKVLHYRDGDTRSR